MALRSELIAEVVKEVLGPRGGPHEILKASPLDEYLTGVLQSSEVRALGLEAQEDKFPEVEAGAGEEDLEEPEIGPVIFTPALDPRMRPSSMGLSFRVRVSQKSVPELQICVTWARYRLEEQASEGNSIWKRYPRWWISPLLQKTNIYYLDGEGKACTSEQAEISLHVRIVEEETAGTYQVTIHLVNRIRPQDFTRVRAEECIFQPQIRVICGTSTVLEPSAHFRTGSDEEDRRLNFLYRKRPVMARGHLVSVVWKDIDPERPALLNQESERPDAPPFVWVDGYLLDEKTRRLFSPPDLRTEFVPVYGVQAPDWDWDSAYARKPVMEADLLAALAGTPENLLEALEPIVQGYKAWIQEREDRIAELSEPEQKVARDLMSESREALERIRAGLHLLTTDADVRLAFAFANKAMALQARWRGRKLRWRPFQLAFILMNIRAVVQPDSEDRKICDLLWIPTGGGKTEAYLGLAAFVLAYRRRRALTRSPAEGDTTGAGVSVLSRYTLRLLTIQQFRRALLMITACEFLRVHGLKRRQPIGWRPENWPNTSDFIWGCVPFRIGLWVGGNLTPNRLETIFVDRGGSKKKPLYGALDILKAESSREETEPAQVLRCPACDTLLAVPEKGLPPGEHKLFLVVRKSPYLANISLSPGPGFEVSLEGTPRDMPGDTHVVLSLRLRATSVVKSQALDRWWKEGPGKDLDLASFRPSRPGYFPVQVPKRNNGHRTVDFEIWCPNPECPLNEEWWSEGVPLEFEHRKRARQDKQRHGTAHPLSGDTIWCRTPLQFRKIPEPWRVGKSFFLSSRVPVPALTVDEQVYRHLPSMVIGTVDKFARLPFLSEASGLFGNINYYVAGEGYSRTSGARVRTVQVAPLDPPDLILQDELHLVEGPLGSLTGLYETAVDVLSLYRNVHPKYIAATATIRAAATQVQSLFARQVRIFPPPGLEIDDRFFIRTRREAHPLDEEGPGQLYAGVCAPGRGPLTPVYRLWAALLEQVYLRRNIPGIDEFWTLAGYFNAIRELAGALALYRQDIPQRIQSVFSSNPRPLHKEPVELSSRVASTDLPAILEHLNRQGEDAPDALLATSMFGTGVDIPRLSLMIVHGQPKTTSAYIQATGRVGRKRGALVVTFLRSTRPRDLSHYEFFCGYHRQLHRHVEPVTVMPFSPGAVDLALGPVMVTLLRHARDMQAPWHQEASLMAARRNAQEVLKIVEILEARAQMQPEGRRPPPGEVADTASAGLDRWQNIAIQYRNELVYVEYAIDRAPEKPVVLGDQIHTRAGLPVVFENVPQSMRDVEETIDLEA